MIKSESYALRRLGRAAEWRPPPRLTKEEMRWILGRSLRSDGSYDLRLATWVAWNMKVAKALTR